MSALFGESVTQARLELCGDGMVEVLDENGDTVPPRLVRVLSERQGDETDAWMHLSDQHLGRPCALEPNRLHCAVSGVTGDDTLTFKYTRNGKAGTLKMSRQEPSGCAARIAPAMPE